VVADQWTMLILQRAFLLRTRRFADWRGQLGVSESVLAGRIKEMVTHDLLRPSEYRETGRARTEYLLTKRALELWSFLIEVWSWERAWAPHRQPLPELLHRSCGAQTDVELSCGACGRAPVTARDTETQRGPTATFAKVAVPRLHRRTVRPAGTEDPLSYYPETFEILGDRWSTVVLAAAFLGVRRFADFESELGITPSVLSGRLTRFTELGIFETGAGTRTEYRLSEKGLAFFGVFALLVDWAQRWYTGPPGTELLITHRACGKPFRPVLRCGACANELARADVSFPEVPRG
jgi:DNA-binding HxlR family transcriptional regulator